MKLKAEELARIAKVTLEHYDHGAEEFWRGTRDHDVSQNIAALLRHIEGAPPFTILDLGCGPGRDLKAFSRARPRRGRASKAPPRFAAMARAHSGCEVWSRISSRSICPAGASTACSPTPCCSTCPARSCRACCGELRAALKPRGVLFSSNPRGRNEEGWNRGRYGAYHDLETWRRYLTAAGFAELEHYSRHGYPCRSIDAGACRLRPLESTMSLRRRHRRRCRQARASVSPCGWMTARCRTRTRRRLSRYFFQGLAGRPGVRGATGTGTRCFFGFFCSRLLRSCPLGTYISIPPMPPMPPMPRHAAWPPPLFSSSTAPRPSRRW